MLIAEMGGCECSPPRFTNISAVRKRWFAEQHTTGAVPYRSGVPDEDLGAAVGELLSRDLEVDHQHLHSFPVRGQSGLFKTTPKQHADIYKSPELRT